MPEVITALKAAPAAPDARQLSNVEFATCVGHSTSEAQVWREGNTETAHLDSEGRAANDRSGELHAAADIIPKGHVGEKRLRHSGGGRDGDSRQRRSFRCDALPDDGAVDEVECISNLQAHNIAWNLDRLP